MDNTVWGPKCATNNWDGSEQDTSEDCLTVNIFADKRKLEANEKVPIVYVCIYKYLLIC